MSGSKWICLFRFWFNLVSRCLHLKSGLMMSTMPWCQLSAYLLLNYTEVLFQSSSSLCRSTCCRTWDIQRVGCGMVWKNEARWARRNVTRHSLSAHSWDSLTHSIPDSRLCPVKQKSACTPSMHGAKILWTITEPWWNREFPRGEQRNYHSLQIYVFRHGPLTWLVMQRNVWSDIVSWQTRRLNNSTKYLLHASMITTSKKKKWNPWESCQKYGLKLYWNVDTWHVLEDPIFHGQWTHLHDHIMDQSLWQTPESFDLLHSSYMWLWTLLSCGKHCKTMQTVTVSRLRICRRSWGFKFYIRRNIVHFWKSYVCSNKLDVQETDCRFSQFNRIWNHLFGHWIEIRRVACSGIKGSNSFCFWKRHSNYRENGATRWYRKKSKILWEDQRAQ